MLQPLVPPVSSTTVGSSLGVRPRVKKGFLKAIGLIDLEKSDRQIN